MCVCCVLGQSHLACDLAYRHSACGLASWLMTSALWLGVAAAQPVAASAGNYGMQSDQVGVMAQHRRALALHRYYPERERHAARSTRDRCLLAHPHVHIRPIRAGQSTRKRSRTRTRTHATHAHAHTHSLTHTNAHITVYACIHTGARTYWSKQTLN